MSQILEEWTGVEIGMTLEFEGDGVNEKDYVANCVNLEFQVEIGKEVVSVDPKYLRPTELNLLIGDPTKSQIQLGWKPKYELDTLVKAMRESHMYLMQKSYCLKGKGY